MLRDALITVIGDSLTSFFAGFAIFSIIGHGAYILDKPIDEVAQAGSTLAVSFFQTLNHETNVNFTISFIFKFVMYPKIISELPGSVFWSLLFFAMLVMIGLDSEFNVMETAFTALLDFMPWFRQKLWRKALLLGIMCSVFFLLGLPMVCQGGANLIDIVDGYSSGWGALFIGVFESLGMAWIYGAWNYHKDMQLVMGKKTWTEIGKWYLIAFWGFITPLLILAILIYSMVEYERTSSNDTEEVLGWCCAIWVLIWIPALALWEVVKGLRRGDHFNCFNPNKFWGPYLLKYRKEIEDTTRYGPNWTLDPRNELLRKRNKAGESNPGFQTENNL